MRRRSSVKSLPVPKFLGCIFLSFIAGYVVAIFFDMNQLSSWVDHVLDREPSTSMARARPHEKELPKPKFEFYSMLSNDAASREHALETAKEARSNAPAQQALATAENKPSNVRDVATSPSAQATNVGVAPAQPKLSPKQAAVLASMSHPIQQVNAVANHAALATPAVSTLPIQKAQPMTGKERYYVQVAAFKSPQEGEKIRASLLLKGYNVSIVPVQTDRGQWYRVMAGPYGTKETVLVAKQQITSRLHMIGIIRKEA